MPTHTSPEDVRDRWLGDEQIPDDAVLDVHIVDAEDTVRSAIPDLDQRITDDRIPLERLVKIVSRMVIRHLQNPLGIRQKQETTGPFTGTVTYGGDEPGTIYLTPAERRELLGRSGQRAFTVDTMPARRREMW